jgi:hypothetical protein
MGSEFHWDDRYLSANAGDRHLLADAVHFASARSAFLALVPHVTPEDATLHLPTFMCGDFSETLATVFSIAWYRDLPSEPAPDLSTLRPAPGDVVLAMNTFGIRGGADWRTWIDEHPEVTVVEDHTHDPFSEWARTSNAGYALASLRKTVPLPDGGVLWSPVGRALPSQPATSERSDRLIAMMLKAAYLRGAAVPKEAFRVLQIEGETRLCEGDDAAPSLFTTKVFPLLAVGELRTRRAANVARVVKQLSGINAAFAPLFDRWDPGATPFNVVLLCRDRETRDAFRRYLIERSVFPAIHWAQDGAVSSGDEDALRLGERLLTLPTDFRYDEQDTDRLVAYLHNFEMS